MSSTSAELVSIHAVEPESMTAVVVTGSAMPRGFPRTAQCVKS
jgi:hypothetical protein